MFPTVNREDEDLQNLYLGIQTRHRLNCKIILRGTCVL
jgi:hypothetical protein